jgi:2TM domain
MTTTPAGGSVDERARARTHIKKRRDLRTHALVYVLVNSAIVGIWAAIGSGGFFWPVFPMVFWGIGLVMNAWDVYVASEITEEDVDREVSRMHRS